MNAKVSAFAIWVEATIIFVINIICQTALLLTLKAGNQKKKIRFELSNASSNSIAIGYYKIFTFIEIKDFIPK